MKKITFKRALALAAWLAAIVLMFVACDYELEIKQVYGFDLETMPVQKKLSVGQTAEIRCTLVREGEYDGVRFFIRMFQYDGRGILQMDDGTTLIPNDLYPLEKMQFRLYYTALSNDQSNISIFIEDSFGQVVEKIFSWQGDTGDDEEDNENIE